MITHETRRASFDKIKEHIGSRQREVLERLESAPEGLTAWELAGALGRQVYTVRPRLTELRNLELIEAFGAHFHEETGRREAIWRVSRRPVFDATGQGILFDGTAYAEEM